MKDQGFSKRSLREYPFDYVVAVFDTFMKDKMPDLEMRSEKDIIDAIANFMGYVVLRPMQCKSLLKFNMIRLESQPQSLETDT